MYWPMAAATITVPLGHTLLRGFFQDLLTIVPPRATVLRSTLAGASHPGGEGKEVQAGLVHQSQSSSHPGGYDGRSWYAYSGTQSSLQAKILVGS